MSASLPPTPVADASTMASASRAEVNLQFLQSVLTAFLKDPEADFKDLIPNDYDSRFHGLEASSGARESKLARQNRQFIAALLPQFSSDPSGDLFQDFGPPALYNVQRREIIMPKPKKGPKKRQEPEKPEKRGEPKELRSDYFFRMLNKQTATTFDIIAPLSQDVELLFENHRRSSATAEDSVSILKTIVRESEFLWSGTLGGRSVAKLNDKIAVRVTYDDQSNSHAVYKFLEEHAPDVLAPKPHGLIRVGTVNVLFLSYIPKVTLTKVWPKLSDLEKVSIQAELDELMCKIRRIPRNDLPLGLLSGPGVIDERGRHDFFQAEKPVQTVAEFEDFLFSYRPWVTETYVRFLKQLLPASRFDEPCVFTHCDIRPANIMVDTDEDGNWHVSGIVDWEEAGFYPAYWESVKATRTFIANMEDDW